MHIKPYSSHNGHDPTTQRLVAGAAVVTLVSKRRELCAEETHGRRLGGGGRGHTRSVECHQALDEGTFQPGECRKLGKGHQWPSSSRRQRAGAAREVESANSQRHLVGPFVLAPATLSEDEASRLCPCADAQGM